MSAHPRTRPAKQLRNVMAAVFAAAALTCSVGIPTAAAIVDANVGYLVNDLHVKDGCAPYGGSDALFQVALQIAQSMAVNEGRRGAPGTFAPTTEQLLTAQGYTANGIGELDWYSPTRVSTRDAYDFWRNNGTRALFKECGLQDMAGAEWIVDGRMAVVVLMATPA